jgi:hypothetical protein
MGGIAMRMAAWVGSSVQAKASIAGSATDASARKMMESAWRGVVQV